MRRNGIRTSITAIFVRLFVGFHGAKFLQDCSSCEMKKVSSRSQNNHHMCKYFEDDLWIDKLASMTDIFEHVNELNIKMQGKNENKVTSYKVSNRK